jgi:hypothetical protein
MAIHCARRYPGLRNLLQVCLNDRPV